jgi:hypothetical protein
MSDLGWYDYDEHVLYLGPFYWPFKWSVYIVMPRIRFFRKRVHPSQR